MRRRCAAAPALFALARRQELSAPRPILVSTLTIRSWVASMGLALA
jgi:hypothetical protein